MVQHVLIELVKAVSYGDVQENADTSPGHWYQTENRAKGAVFC